MSRDNKQPRDTTGGGRTCKDAVLTLISGPPPKANVTMSRDAPEASERERERKYDEGKEAVGASERRRRRGKCNAASGSRGDATDISRRKTDISRGPGRYALIRYLSYLPAEMADTSLVQRRGKGFTFSYFRGRNLHLTSTALVSGSSTSRAKRSLSFCAAI